MSRKERQSLDPVSMAKGEDIKTILKKRLMVEEREFLVDDITITVGHPCSSRSNLRYQCRYRNS